MTPAPTLVQERQNRPARRPVRPRTPVFSNSKNSWRHGWRRVKVQLGKGPGRLVIDFADLTDLERIYRVITPPGTTA